MNKRFSVILLLLCLAILGVSRPGLAGSSRQVPADLQDRLEKEGWQSVSPGVMQRTLDTRTETLGFGAEGLRFQLIEMKEHLDFLRKELEREPSRELRAAIRAHRAAILRVQAAARKAEAPGGLESVQEGLRAEGADCPVDYDAVVDSFPLTQGVSASASSSFKNDCGYVGEVYAHAYAKATNAANQVATMTQSDPAPGAYRTGGTVSAEASAGVNGVKDCYSYSYAEVINYDLGITYAVQDTDSRCSGTTGVRPFANDAPGNVALPASPPLDPNSAAIVANLSSGRHDAVLYRYGKPAYDASAGTPRAIVCTKTSWGTCEASLQPVPIHAAWKPSAGGDGAMAVIDYVNRKIYDFYQVAKNADGTVMINADGTVTAGWGSVVDLDGYGGEAAVNGSGLSNMFGTIRVFEMERAAADPENAIQHALAFNTQYACGTYRYPAAQSNGVSTGTGCIPVGSRVFLDSGADCSTMPTAGEKAVCYALQKYGAYALGQSGATLGLKFEIVTDGQPGGSGPSAYPGAGFTGDYYALTNIPWSRLKVAKDCLCSPY